MIHEILKILDTTELHELEKQRITTDLLRLFNVVGQNEQLPSCDKCGYYIHPENKTCLREGCENY